MTSLLITSNYVYLFAPQPLRKQNLKNLKFHLKLVYIINRRNFTYYNLRRTAATQLDTAYFTKNRKDNINDKCIHYKKLCKKRK